MTNVNMSDTVALETLLDKLGARALCAALSDICDAKAIHLEEAWQDSAMALDWRRAARAFDRLVICKALKALA